MEQEFPIDADEVRRTLDRAEVIALFFPRFRKTLLLDTRRTRVDPPLVRVVAMVGSSEERLASLRRLRPRLAEPESLALIPWPRSVASLKTLGIWQALAERLTSAEGEGCDVALERCYRELVRDERAEFRRAVVGDGYRTLWQRAAR